MGKKKAVAYTEDYGEKVQFDADFKGPLGRRSCTDIICLLIFLVFCGGWAAVGIVAYTTGNLSRILAPGDTWGRLCGVDPGVEDKPYLFIFDFTRCINVDPLSQGCNTPQVCVENCPTETIIARAEVEIPGRNLTELAEKLICKYDFDKYSISTAEEMRQAFDNNNCSPWYFKSSDVAQRCIPGFGDVDDIIHQLEAWNLTIDAFKNGSEISQVLSQAREIGEMVVSDLNESWPLILGGLAIAMAVCLIFIILMRWIAGFMVWFSLFGVVGLLAYCCYASYVKYDDLSGKEAPSLDGHTVAEQAEAILALKETWLVFLIAAAITLVIVLLIIIFLRNRIRIAVALIREASRAVSSVTSTLAFPLVPWGLELGVVAWSIAVGLYLASSGSAVFRVTGLDNTTSCVCDNDYENGAVCSPEIFNTSCHENLDQSCTNASCSFFRFETESYIIYMHIYNFFGFFWGLFFMSAFGEMALAGTFATWYWTFKKSDVPFFTLTSSVGRTLRYHLGTLAFGSLILAICRMIRVILEYISAKLRKFDNAFVKALLCCLRCFFWCLEKFIRFINRNAYIMCSIHGKNFCRSAKDAFNLLMRNMLRVFVLDKVTDFLLFLGRLFITAGMVALSFYIFSDTFDTPDEVANQVPKLNYYLVPVFIIGFGTYFIAGLFFGVYAMAVDTLFLCFLEDIERNDGSPQKPYFMSKQLMKILGKKNKRS